MTAADTDPGTDTGPDVPRWGAADVIGAFLVAQVASAIGLAIYAASEGLALQDINSETLTMAEAALLQVPLWLGLLGAPLLSTWWRGNGPVHDLGLRVRWGDVPRGLAIGIGCQLVLVPLVTWPILELTGASTEDLEAPARELTDKAQGAGILLLLLVVVVGAPIAEEVFYRGLLQRTLARRLPAWLTIGITAVVFGASHLQGLQFPALALFGVVLSYLAHRTGRLGLSIWAHVGFNATTVLLLLAVG